MENLIVRKGEIVWDRAKKKHQSNIVYRSKVIKYDFYFVITKTMYVDGQVKSHDVVELPTQLIDNLKGLDTYEDVDG